MGKSDGNSGKLPGKQGDDGRAAARQARLAEELRANLKKRKAQARARRSGTENGATGPDDDTGKR